MKGEAALDRVQSAPVRNPGAGRNFLYPKTDDRWYGRDSSGAEKLVGPWGLAEFTTEMIGLRATSGSTQSLADSAATKITLSATPDYQVGAISASSSEATISVAGVYHLSGSLQFAVNATGVRRLWIEWYTGADPGAGAGNRLASSTTPAFSTYTCDLSTEDIVTLPAGAKVRLVGFQTSGGSLNVTSAVPGVVARMNVRLLSAQTQYGQELGYAEIYSAFSTTNTTLWSTAGSSLVTGLSVTVIGTGRPAEITFWAPAVTHGTAGVVSAYLVVNGATNNANSQLGNFAATPAAAGTSPMLVRRLTLTAGVSYTFQVGIVGSASGASVVSCSAGFPAFLSVVQQ